MKNIVLTELQAAEVCTILRTVLMPMSPSSQAPAKAWVFGSSPALDWRARADLQDAFEASKLPFRVDVVEESRLAPTMAPRVLAERQYLPF
jgi:hypothetical protein